MESKWSQNGVNMEFESIQKGKNWSQMESKMSQMESKWSQNGVKMESKWSPTECCLRKYEIQYLILKCCLKLKKCLRHQKVQFEELWSLTSLLEKAKKKIHACYEVKRQVNERW